MISRQGGLCRPECFDFGPCMIALHVASGEGYDMAVVSKGLQSTWWCSGIYLCSGIKASKAKKFLHRVAMSVLCCLFSNGMS